MDRHLTFFHAPNSRSAGVRVLLEELDADFELRVLDLKKGQQLAPAYLAVNPMGKVPAIVHGDALVTEQPAISWLTCMPTAAWRRGSMIRSVAPTCAGSPITVPASSRR
jgi:hypothetical protein